MRILIWIYFLLYLAGQSHPSIWTLYTQYKFNWSTFEVGLSLSFVGLSAAFVQGYLTRIVVPKWGEVKALYIGVFFSIVAYAGYAFSNHGWMMYVIMAVTCLQGIVGPAAMSLVSRDTPPQEQGELQGTLISIASLTSIIGPLIYTDIFARFTAEQATYKFAGAPYFLAGIVCFVSWILFMVYSKTHPPTVSASDSVSPNPLVH